MVIRIDKKDKDNVLLVNARPCQNCLEMMKSIGIRRVYYSNNHGEIVCENIKDMISIHSSRVMIKIDVYTTTNISRKIINPNDINQFNQFNEISEDKYWEQIIKNKIPNVVKEENFNNFINYDFKSLESKYKIIISKVGCEKKAQIINSSNQVIKSLIII